MAHPLLSLAQLTKLFSSETLMRSLTLGDLFDLQRLLELDLLNSLIALSPTASYPQILFQSRIPLRFALPSTPAADAVATAYALHCTIPK